MIESERVFYIDDAELERMQAGIAAFGDGADDAITEVIHRSGPDIYERINPLIHPSGRRFKGHSSSATASAWPRYIREQHLAVTVTTKSRYRYLYFPDDGANTRRHAGHQRFFARGAEAAAPGIIEKAMARLMNDWKG